MKLNLLLLIVVILGISLSSQNTPTYTYDLVAGTASGTITAGTIGLINCASAGNDITPAKIATAIEAAEANTSTITSLTIDLSACGTFDTTAALSITKAGDGVMSSMTSLTWIFKQGTTPAELAKFLVAAELNKFDNAAATFKFDVSGITFANLQTEFIDLVKTVSDVDGVTFHVVINSVVSANTGKLSYANIKLLHALKGTNRVITVDVNSGKCTQITSGGQSDTFLDQGKLCVFNEDLFTLTPSDDIRDCAASELTVANTFALAGGEAYTYEIADTAQSNPIAFTESLTNSKYSFAADKFTVKTHTLKITAKIGADAVGEKTVDFVVGECCPDVGSIKDAQNAGQCVCDSTNKFEDAAAPATGCVCMEDYSLNQSKECELTCGSSKKLENGACVACGDNMVQKDDDNTKCVCAEDYAMNDQNVCELSCGSSKKLENGACVACGANMVQKEGDNTKCVCAEDYSMNSQNVCELSCGNDKKQENGACVACGANMVQDSKDKTKCACKSGYEMDSKTKKCVKEEKENSSGNVLVALNCVFLVVVAAFIV